MENFMRFRYKVLSANIAFLSIAFGVLGFILIYTNSKHAMQLQTDYAIEEHLLLQGSIEYQLMDYINSSKSLKDDSSAFVEALADACKATCNLLIHEDTILCIIHDNTVVYTNSREKVNIPVNLYKSVGLGSKSYITTKDQGKYNLYVATQHLYGPSDPIYIITIKDVTKSYNTLNKQIGYSILLIAFVLIICGIFIYIISMKLTKPLENLNRVTDKISEGDYSTNVSIQSDDEIGLLAIKFNDMTQAISDRIYDLNQMIKQREQFVADFTHEIKTPMTAIIGYADTLKSRELPKESRDMAYDYIYSEGKRLESMSMKLFDLIYLKDHDISLSEIHTDNFAKEIVCSITPLLEKKNITLETDVKHEIIFGENELLKTVFINLIDNAKKASTPGSKIIFKGFTEGDFYKFQVIDEGCGMDEETTKHICDEFYMADKSRSRAEGGAGLGLSLAAIIIKCHNATLDIKSELNIGTTMTVNIPLR